MRFSDAGVHPTEPAMLAALVPLWNDPKAAIYLLEDGDAIIVWGGTQKAVLEQIVANIYRHFKLDPAGQYHHYYDLLAHTESLRQLAQKKLVAVETASNQIETAGPTSYQIEAILALPQPNEEELARFRKAAAKRGQRKRPHILIIEDQLFSRKLLLGLLDELYPCMAAADATAAFALHLEEAPDILLLDIELPNINGHTLAAAIRKFDDTVSIIMVTANNYLDDVKRARENKAKGFVVKPYSKQKILDAITAYSPANA
jgi:CheY-like chemotaxis protein